MKEAKSWFLPISKPALENFAMDGRQKMYPAAKPITRVIVILNLIQNLGGE